MWPSSGSALSEFPRGSDRRLITAGNAGRMTLTALITLNAILGAAVVYGLVGLLVEGIRSDPRARVAEPARTHRELERIAA
jgi:hypothetical protein